MVDFIAFAVMCTFGYGFCKAVYWIFKSGIERQTHLKKAALYMISSFIVFVVISLTTDIGNENKSPSANIDNNKQDSQIAKSENDYNAKRNAFVLWKKEYDAALALFDLSWLNWKGTMDMMSKGKISQHTAWTNMKTLNNDMKSVRAVFRDMKAPDILGDDAKILNKATEDICDTCISRAMAVEKMMKMLDDGSFKPSKIDEVMQDIQYGDTLLVGALNSVKAVGRVLGVREDKIASK